MTASGCTLNYLVAALFIIALWAGSVHGAASAIQPPHNLYSVQADGALKILWTPAAVAGIASYKIYRGTDGAAFSLLATVSSSATTYIDAGYSTTTPNFYRVTAVDAAGAESVPSGITGNAYHTMQVASFRPVTSGKAVVGDYNGDGIPDIALADSAACSGKGRRAVCGGKIDIYFGGHTNRKGVPDVTLTGEASQEGFGYAMAVADLNRDGFDDLIVGAPFFDPNVTSGYVQGTAKDGGKIYVFLGGVNVSAVPAFTREGTFSYANNGGSYYILKAEQFGYSMASVGDINGDGYPDVAIGVPNGGMDLSGSVKILYGGTSIGAMGVVNGPMESDYMGTSVAAAGDVNGDGYPDIIAGAPNDLQPRFDKKSYLIHGGTQPRIADSIPDGFTNYAVAVAGLDFNGDGMSDLVFRHIGLGVATDIFNGSASPDATLDRTLLAATAVASLGDMDKDGHEDLLVDGPAVIFGTANQENYSKMRCPTALTIIGMGDTDGDGVKDIIGTDGSSTFICSTVSFKGLPVITLTSPQAGDIKTMVPEITLSGRITGDITRLFVGGSAVQTAPDGSFQTTLSLAEGTNTIEIIALALDGRIAKKAMTVTYTIPTVLTVAITKPADRTVVNSASLTVSGMVSHPAVNITVNSMPAALSGISFQGMLTLSEGVNTITALASDSSGNTSTHSIMVTLLTMGAVTGTVTDTATGKTLPGVSITITSGGSTHQTTTDTLGKYTLFGLAEGAFTAGFSKPGYLDLTMDGTATKGQMQSLNVQISPSPSLALVITSPADGAVLTATPAIVTGTVTNGAGVTVNGIQAIVANNTFTATLPLLGGINTITAIASDPYRQVTTVSRTVTLNVPARITVTPSEIWFGTTKTGQVKTSDITVSNASAIKLAVGMVARPAAPFWAVSDNCSGRTLSPAERCTISLQFAPVAKGSSSGSLVIPTDDPYYPLVNVALHGDAVPKAAYVVPDTGQGGSARNPLSYTITGDNTARDDNTGLIWQRSAGPVRGSWADADAYCRSLSLDGLERWRLPGFVELMSIVHYGRANPAIDPQIFTYTPADEYWTSTAETMAGGVSGGRTVSFMYGEASPLDKALTASVRCVNGPLLAPNGFVTTGGWIDPNAEGTIEDLDSGLVWMGSDVNVDNGWDSVIGLCGSIAYAGYHDWRLPTIKELASFPIASCHIDNCFAWSTTPSNRPDAAGNLTQVYLSNLADIISAPKTGPHGLRCVRGGNRMPADPWRIAFSPPVLDFGSRQRGTLTDMVLTVSNGGSGTLVIGTIVLPAAPFTILSDGCSGQSLPAAAACQVMLRLSSLSVGTFSSILTIPSNDADNPSAKAPLIGTVLVPETVLTGTVVDAVSFMPLPAAAVTAVDSSSTARTVLTDAGGAYLFADMVTGVFSGSISKQGYAPFSFAGNLASKQVVNINAALFPILPQISMITAEPTASTAVVRWTTDQAASSVVEYGETAAYGNTISDAALTLQHTVKLSGIKPSTLYHYRVSSTNGFGFTTTSADQTITTPLFSAKHLGDNGNVTVIEVDGNYDAKYPDGSNNDQPRLVVAKEYFKNHSDLDFLVFLSTFDYTMPEVGAEGFYLGVKNDTQGINQPIFDNSAQFGSPGKLQGTIDLGNITTLAAAPYSPLLEKVVKTLNHELGHRFGSYVRFKNPDGTLNAALLGKDSAHWSYLLDSQGSIMYGNGWKDNKDGTFTSVSARSGFSPLDLYLMGMIPKEQVPPMLLINNPAIDRTKLPQLGATITGAANTITIDDIIAAVGERVPSATTSQKKFNVGFVLLTRPGDNTGPALQAIETLRKAWAGRLAEQTNGIGGINGIAPSVSVAIDSPVEGASITGPDVTVSGAIINTSGIETGVVVNGVPATVSGNRFIVNHVSLQEGANTITITATDINGLSATTTRNVTSQSGNYLRISTNVESGTAPVGIAFNLAGSFNIATPQFNCSGPMPVTLTPGTSQTEFSAILMAEGAYTFTAGAVGPDGQTYSDSITIIVNSKEKVDYLLRSKWNAINTYLISGNATAALRSFTSYTREKYQAIFNEVSAIFPNILATYRELTTMEIGDGIARYKLTTNENGKIYAFDVVFEQEENGLWLLRSY